MQNKKYKILAIIIFILCCLGLYFGFLQQEEVTESVINEVEDCINTTEVAVSDETQQIANETIEATKNDEDISTTEIIESSEEEEQTLEEEALETDAVVEQENISYDGDSTGSELSLLGSYQGLTYYSQADSRWANVMYSSIGDTSQTMKSSACRTNFGSNSRKF